MARPLRLFALLLGAYLFTLPEIAAADLQWLKQATDCASFNRGVTGYFEELGDLGRLSAEQRREVSHVIEEACGPRFASCNFLICRERAATQAAASGDVEFGEEFDGADGDSSEPFGDSSAGVEPVEGELRGDEGGPTAGDQSVAWPTAEPARSPFPTDPLAWLEQPLTCDGFLEQIQIRYAPLGKFSELPPAKKAEVRQVLNLVCSERFAHCDFPSCRKLAKGSRAATASKGEGSTMTAAEQKAEVQRRLKERLEFIREEFELRRAQQNELIAAKQQEERRKGLEWQRFSIREELEARKPEKREPPRRQPSTPSFATPEQSSGSKSSYTAPKRGSSTPKRGSGRPVGEERDQVDMPRPGPRPGDVPAKGIYTPRTF